MFIMDPSIQSVRFYECKVKKEGRISTIGPFLKTKEKQWFLNLLVQLKWHFSIEV